MTDIERSGTLNPELIDGEHYFSSFLSEAVAHGLIDIPEFQKIQLQLIELLAEKTLAFTAGRSSSVKTERAEAIMNSLLYTLGLALKSFPSFYDALDALKNQSIQKLYSTGSQKIHVKLNTARLYASLVQRSMFDSDNYTYKTTFIDGINGFFKIYDPKYGADRIGITADYPLCLPVKELTGVEFICKYLESAYYENSFCLLFPSENRKHLLNGAYSDTTGMIFNIFRTVLTASLISALTEGNIYAPEPNQKSIALLINKISLYGIFEMRMLFAETAKRLCGVYDIKNTAEKKYVIRSAELLGQEVFHAIRLGCPERVLTAIKKD